MKKQLKFLILILFLLAGCAALSEESSRLTPVPEMATVDMQLYEIAYPGPGTPDATLRSPAAYPAPEGVIEIEPTIAVFSSPPTPGNETGVVIGQLISQETGEPLAFYTVYLGTIVHLTPGPDYMYSLQEKSSPHTSADSMGQFALGNVTPGEYILFVWTPFNASVMIDPDTDKELIVNAEAGQTLDLGVLQAIKP